MRRLAFLNAAHETGYASPLDQTLRDLAVTAVDPADKRDEIPFDFVRRRLSVLLATDGGLLITKGAVGAVLDACDTVETAAGVVPLDGRRAAIEAGFTGACDDGLRVIAVATRALPGRLAVTRDDERGMTFAGLVRFHDPPKADVRAALDELAGLGVAVKVVTGDNAAAARALARRLGIAAPVVVTGTELRRAAAAALPALARTVDIFAEVEPTQKEQIVTALRRSGHVVGFLGDGINDAPALHAADVGISVAGAADVAREAADLVLLEKELSVVARGLREGRRTFANTLKYVFMATSANFGNMFSMAGASLFLPFLPLVPKQVLLTNMLTDMPEMAIASDTVDDADVARPRRWDLGLVRRFMLVFGLAQLGVRLPDVRGVVVAGRPAAGCLPDGLVRRIGRLGGQRGAGHPQPPAAGPQPPGAGAGQGDGALRRGGGGAAVLAAGPAAGTGAPPSGGAGADRGHRRQLRRRRRAGEAVVLSPAWHRPRHSGRHRQSGMAAREHSQPNLVRDLLRPGAYGAAVERVSLRATHASWVFLTDTDVFKVKRPVDLGFLDYRTLADRYRACQEEVRLNARLAPDVYLGVVPVYLTDRGYALTGGGPVAEWAVHMRRLPDAASAAAALARGALDAAALECVAVRLGEFLRARDRRRRSGRRPRWRRTWTKISTRRGGSPAIWSRARRSTRSRRASASSWRDTRGASCSASPSSESARGMVTSGSNTSTSWAARRGRPPR